MYNMTYTLYSEFSLINCHSLPVLTVMYVHILKLVNLPFLSVPVDFRHLFFATTPLFHVNNLVLSCRNPHHHNSNRCTLQQNGGTHTGRVLFTTITSNFSEPFSLYNTERIWHIKM